MAIVIKPSIGRIVHYVSYGTPNGEFQSECRAAIITDINKTEIDGEIDPFAISLCVINPSGMFFNTSCGYSEDRRGGSWHWPERVE